MKYEDLINEAHRLDLCVKELGLCGSNGRIKGRRISIRKDIPTLREKACVLAEELGHYYTSVGEILDMRYADNRKQELKARLWAYNKQIGLLGIIRAYEYGCCNLYEMAEYLNVTEDFLKEALISYQNKYGKFVTIDNYIIYFIPCLMVIKMI